MVFIVLAVGFIFIAVALFLITIAYMIFKICLAIAREIRKYMETKRYLNENKTRI